MSKLRYTVLSRGTKRVFNNGNDCTPVKWTQYFQIKQNVCVDEDVFNVYRTGKTGPLLLLIHGGGYSALTWSLFAEEVATKVDCQILAVDIRGHGSTKTKEDGNLALDVLANDISNILDQLYPYIRPPIVIVGHSLGGAVAVAAAAIINSVIGVCVIDVVEGTAIESLSSMQSILRGRPSGFKSIEQAIQWSFRGGQTHNLEAARVSMPGQIKNLLTGNLAADEDEHSFLNGDCSVELDDPSVKPGYQSDTILEEKEDDTITNGGPSCDRLINKIERPLTKKPPLPCTAKRLFKVPEQHNLYTWRIDLSKTEPFWSGWFKGLSQNFLNLRLPKILLLANINGLDTALTVGQMQGKFQLQVLPRSGHAIHEDQPQHVAEIVAAFLVNHKIGVAKKGFIPIMPAC